MSEKKKPNKVKVKGMTKEAVVKDDTAPEEQPLEESQLDQVSGGTISRVWEPGD